MFVFRGHASNKWPLKPTIDRLDSIPSKDAERNEFLATLLDEFKKCCEGLNRPIEEPKEPEEWEYLGRHHGLPTSIIDWTDSPYVAAYFAFEPEPIEKAEYASVWVLNRSMVEWDHVEGVKIDEFDCRFNQRSAEQRGLSMQIQTCEQSVEDLLGRALLRIDVKRSARIDALRELDEMLVNRRNLFRDIDGAATTAKIRLGCDL